MSAIFLIINALLPIVIAELQQFKVLSPSMASLIIGIEGAASAFTADITGSSGAVSITASSLLAAISAGVSVLQTQTTVSPVTLSIVNSLDKAITAGITASNAATSLDTTKLLPIQTIS